MGDGVNLTLKGGWGLSEHSCFGIDGLDTF